MSDRAEQGEFELPIGINVVVGIIDAARAAEEMEEEDINEDVQDPESPDDDDAAGVGSELLRGLIEDLNEDDQAALVALVWIGRGDREPGEWAEVVTLARERAAEGPVADYLMGMEMLGDLLSEGLAACGIIAEDVPR